MQKASKEHGEERKEGKNPGGKADILGDEDDKDVIF
jgi:hypothetical protein